MKNWSWLLNKSRISALLFQLFYPFSYTVINLSSSLYCIYFTSSISGILNPFCWYCSRLFNHSLNCPISNVWLKSCSFLYMKKLFAFKKKWHLADCSIFLYVKHWHVMLKRCLLFINKSFLSIFRIRWKVIQQKALLACIEKNPGSKRSKCFG